MMSQKEKATLNLGEGEVAGQDSGWGDAAFFREDKFTGNAGREQSGLGRSRRTARSSLKSRQRARLEAEKLFVGSLGMSALPSRGPEITYRRRRVAVLPSSAVVGAERLRSFFVDFDAPFSSRGNCVVDSCNRGVCIVHLQIDFPGEDKDEEGATFIAFLLNQACPAGAGGRS